ncbi:hypothetical protein TrCOL_g4860 [Triparma columacea]|uniref:Uncharacterized protein n=1 Tax=Triparma columacea TaxID=722753 RepID=A0A9W7LFT0_9STRA|nr:hypothetical protein TrCOL_g4860 [Triparma columacea]
MFARFIKGEVVKERVKEGGISGLGEEELTLSGAGSNNDRNYTNSTKWSLDPIGGVIIVRSSSPSGSVVMSGYVLLNSSGYKAARKGYVGNRMELPRIGEVKEFGGGGNEGEEDRAWGTGNAYGDTWVLVIEKEEGKEEASLLCWQIDRVTLTAKLTRNFLYFGSNLTNVRFSVVSDLFVLHDNDTRVSFVYDVKADGVEGPVGGGRMVERGGLSVMTTSKEAGAAMINAGFNLPESPKNSGSAYPPAPGTSSSSVKLGNKTEQTLKSSPFGFEDPRRTVRVMKLVLNAAITPPLSGYESLEVTGGEDQVGTEKGEQQHSSSFGRSTLFGFAGKGKGGEYEEIVRGGLVTVSQNDIVETVLLPAMEKEEGILHVKDSLMTIIESLVSRGCNVSPCVVALATEALCRTGHSRVAVGLLRSKEGGQELYGRDEVELAKILFAIGDKHDKKFISLHGLDMLKRIGTNEARGIIMRRFLDEGDFLGAIREGRGGRGGEEGWPTSGDFWRAAVKKASEVEEGERARLLYLLFVFLKGYGEKDVSTKIGKGGEEGGQQQNKDGAKRRQSWKEKERAKGLRVESKLASEVGGAFPEGLIKNQQVRNTLKGMFGFA